MRRVLGVAAVVAVLCVGGFAHGQEGWGTTTDQTTGSGETGWGTPTPTPAPAPAPAPTPAPAPAPETGGGGTGWGTPTQPTPPPQAADPEAPAAGSQGWAQQGGSQPAAGPAEPTGNEFRLAHRIALGASNHMSGAFTSAGDGVVLGGGDADFTTPWINLSFMYTISELFTIEAFAGFYVDNWGVDTTGQTWFEMALGPRALFTLATFDRTRIYTGIGLALLVGYLDTYNDEARSDGGCGGSCGGGDMFGVAFAAPIGVEYRFRSAPHIALSFEVNFHLVYESFGTRALDSDGDIEANDLVSRVFVGMGNPRVTEGSANFWDYLNFLTVGLHYLL